MAVTEQTGGSVPADPPPVVIAAPAASRAGDRSQYADKTLARPLFSQNRRPAADTAIIAADLPKPLPRLTGVVVSPVGGFAIFANAEDGRSIVVGEGGSIGSAVVDTIAAGRVIMRGPDGIIVLHPAGSEMASEVSRIDSASLAMPGYRRPQEGHYEAFWKTAAIAAHPGSNR